MASTDWKERIAPGEAEELARLAEVMRGIQQRRAAKTGQVDRALHAKANAGLAAELRVTGDVPEPLRVGIFAKPGTYRGWVRYSNGAGNRQHDKLGDIRGLALKLVGIEGKKLIPGLEDAKTQDFLFVRASTAPTRTAAEFVSLVHAIEKPALAVFRLIAGVGLVRAFQIIGGARAGITMPVLPLAATTYYSVLPIMWGKQAVKLMLTPRDSAPGALPIRTSATALGDELAERLSNGVVMYDLQAQLFDDERTTPIEDPSVDWGKEGPAPQKIGELVIPTQDPTSASGKKLAAFVEALSFDPWHAPVEFRPLGQLMRMRNQAYRVSTEERKAAREPDGSESFNV
jgi:hypothetical protein